MGKRFQRHTQRQRDLLTGAPISPDACVRRSRSDSLTRPVPMTINALRIIDPHSIPGPAGPIDVSDSLGQLAWSPGMTDYMRDVQTKEQTDWRAWWRVPYVVDRLYWRAEGPDALWSYEAVDAVLAFLRGLDYQDYTDHTPHWLRRHESKMRRYVRATLLPYETPRRAALARPA